MAGSPGNNRSGDSVIELIGKIMVVAIILLFFVVVFAFGLHIYAKWYFHRRRGENPTTTTRRRRLDFAAGHQEITVVSRRGLDSSVLKTIPVVLFDPKQFKDGGLECAVCLSDVCEGEKARLLPKCNHGFHVECIDMWFQSHSTCPLCRNPIADQKQSDDDSALENTIQENSDVDVDSSIEVPISFPTNVLFWGDETRVSTFGTPCVEDGHQGSSSIDEPSSSSSSSSSSLVGSTSKGPDGVLVIDIPRQINEEEEQKSPMAARFRTLKRLLSGNRRVNPSSPRNLDVEQGGRGQC